VTLGEHWNGATWRTRSTPNPKRASVNYLAGVACTSPSRCVAVGQGNGAGTPVALGERWNGTGWTMMSAISPVGAAESQLNGVACPTTSRCVAVGTAGPTRGVNSTIAERWGGAAWRLQPMPSVPGSSLNAVSCASPTDCEAVGGSRSGTLAERWDGQAWVVQPTPHSAVPPGSGLNGVECTSSSNCLAVGAAATSSGGALPLTERWNGTKWAVIPSPRPKGSVMTFLGGISCTSAVACTVVGEQHSVSGNVRTVAERWNGVKWHIQVTANPVGVDSSLSGVSCTGSASCIAVGVLFDQFGNPAGQFAERWNGASWTLVPTVALSSLSALSGITCLTSSRCTAVGFSFVNGGGALNAARWDGTSWRQQRSPLLPAAHDISFPGVSCPAIAMCMAVGGFENDGPGSKTLAEQFDGVAAPNTQRIPAAVRPQLRQKLPSCVLDELTGVGRIRGEGQGRSVGQPLTEVWGSRLSPGAIVSNCLGD